MSGQVGEIIVREIPNPNLGGVATSAFARLVEHAPVAEIAAADTVVQMLPRAELTYAGSLAGTSEVELEDRSDVQADRQPAMAA